MKRESIGAIGVVHSHFLVRRKGERIFFDLFLPHTAEEFTSIAAVAQVMKDAPTFNASRPWQDSSAGHLAIRWCHPGDVFFMQKVDAIETFDKDYRPLGLSHPGGSFWQGQQFQVGGGRVNPTAISIPWDCRHIRGAYVDEINKARAVDNPYKVDIHLTFRKRP
jgi:hypothetical protein